VQCSSSHCLPTPTHLSTHLARHLGNVEYHCYLDSSHSEIAAIFIYFLIFQSLSFVTSSQVIFGWQITVWLFAQPVPNLSNF
jgi:hypothetical protein